MKRGVFPLIFIAVFGVAGSLLFVWFLSHNAAEISNIDTVGDDQLALLTTYNKADAELFYIDQSATLSSGQALYFLHEDQLIDAPCGTYAGVPLWTEERCRPSTADIGQALVPLAEHYLRSPLQGLVSTQDVYFDLSPTMTTNLGLMGIPSDSLEYQFSRGGTQ